MNRRQVLAKLLAAALVSAVSGGARAECGCHCPRCGYVCQLKVSVEKEKHQAWEIECKPICIPRINLPWKKCCEPVSARVKTVHVLKPVEYECEQCHYTWTAIDPCAPKEEQKSEGKKPEEKKSEDKKPEGEKKPETNKTDSQQGDEQKPADNKQPQDGGSKTQQARPVAPPPVTTTGVNEPGRLFRVRLAPRPATAR